MSAPCLIWKPAAIWAIKPVICEFDTLQLRASTSASHPDTEHWQRFDGRKKKDSNCNRQPLDKGVSQLCLNGCRRSKQYWYLGKRSSQLRVKFSPELHERHGSGRSSGGGGVGGGRGGGRTHAHARSCFTWSPWTPLPCVRLPADRSRVRQKKTTTKKTTKQKKTNNRWILTLCPFAGSSAPVRCVWESSEQEGLRRALTGTEAGAALRHASGFARAGRPGICIES